MFVMVLMVMMDNIHGWESDWKLQPLFLVPLPDSYFEQPVPIFTKIVLSVVTKDFWPFLAFLT